MPNKKVKGFKIGVVQESTSEFESFEITTTKAIYEFTKKLGWANEIEEYVHVICINKTNKVISYSEVSHGNINSSVVDPRSVFSRAMLSNARGVIVVHNHPSGDITPSNADIDITRRLKESGIILGINLVDHIIITSNEYISLRDYGVI